jgi:hypothetical protein
MLMSWPKRPGANQSRRVSKGWSVWQQIEQYMRRVYQDNGYQEVRGPQILDRIRPNVANLRAAQNWAIDAGETDLALRTMPSRFSAVAQWFELTWGNRIDTAAELRDRLYQLKEKLFGVPLAH